MAHGLARLRARRAFDLVTVDIDTDPELVERFGDKIPVLADGDREICRYVLDESRVEALLREV
ncbi:MAG: glutaredoxin family protein [Gammaproteobacteria bacterium]|nr:glutaredoxin family protein [Gammaproteobacteria bacterium]